MSYREGMTIDSKTILITAANRGFVRALVEEGLRRGAKRVYAGTRQLHAVQRKDIMCPVCIASTAMIVAGGSTGGILAVCIGKFRKFFRPKGSRTISQTKEK